MSKELSEVVYELDVDDTDLFDSSNPVAVTNVAPPQFQQAIKAIPKSFFEMSVDELKAMGKCGLLEERLRHSFWLEYGNATQRSRNIKLSDIHNGVCSREYLVKNILNSSAKVAFIITPPSNYKVALSEMLTKGLDDFREILALPNVDENGKTNSNLIASKIKIMEIVMARTMGAVVQKVEQKNLTVNKIIDETSEAVEDQIQQLEEKLKQLSHGAVIDVTKKEGS